VIEPHFNLSTWELTRGSEEHHSKLRARTVGHLKCWSDALSHG